MKKELLAYEHHKESTDIVQYLGSRHMEKIKRWSSQSLEQLLAESNHMNGSSSTGAAEAS